MYKKAGKWSNPTAYSNWPFPYRCPSFLSPCFQNWKHTKISAIQKKKMDFPTTNTVSPVLSFCPVQNGHEDKASHMWPLVSVPCPWLPTSGLPRSCTCFQSLSAWNSKYKLLSLASSPALCMRSFTVLCCQAAEPWTLEGRVQRKRELLGTTSKHVYIPQKMEEQDECFGEGIREIRV